MGLKEESLRIQEDFLSDKKLLEIVKMAIYRFEGDMTILESSIGALCLGRIVGWHGLRVMHSSRTMKRYEEILGIRFKELLRPRTEHSTRLQGIRAADKIGKFWQAISGGLISAEEGRIGRTAT